MKPDEIRRLVSEHAAGTISDADLQLLMQEALENQEAFDAVTLDRPLAEIMGDPSSRAELRAALEPEREAGLFARLWRPWPLAAIATTAVALFAVLVSRHVYTPLQPATPQQEVSAPARAKATIPDTVPVPPSSAGGGLADTAERRAVPAVERDKKSIESAGPSIASTVLRPPPEKGRSEEKDTATAEVRADRDIAEPMRPTAPAAPVEKPVEVARGTRTEGLGTGVAGGIPGGVVGGVIREIAAPPPKRQAAKNEAAVSGAALPTAPQQARFASDERPTGRGGSAAASVRLLRQSADGTFEAVPTGTVFRPGERLRLEVTPSAAGFLRVIELDPDGTWKQLYPPEGSGGTRIATAAPVQIPGEGAWDAGPPGTDRRVYLVITPEPQTEMVPTGGTEIRIRTTRPRE